MWDNHLITIQIPVVGRHCSGQDDQIDIGTYTDIESAVIVNDAFCILNSKHQYLTLLQPYDEQFFHALSVGKFNRGRSQEMRLIEIINEKFPVLQNSTKYRQKRRRMEGNEENVNQQPPHLGTF